LTTLVDVVACAVWYATNINTSTVYATEVTNNSLCGSKEKERDEYTLSVTKHLRFDTDSVPIKVDNCSTHTLTGYKKDFIHDTIKSVLGKQVRGFGNTISKITLQGTVQWDVYDDEGIRRQIIVPNSYYVPDCEMRLLSPQHWAQELNDNYPIPDGTMCSTYQDRVVLLWNQKRHVKTMSIDPDCNNVATMWTIGTNWSTKTFANLTNLVFNNEVQVQPVPVNTEGTVLEKASQQNDEYVNEQDEEFEFHRNIVNEEVLICETTETKGRQVLPENELLKWHIRFGHIPMSRVQKLAIEGVLPRRRVNLQYVRVAYMENSQGNPGE
jgi:hypothetical protein